MASSKPMNFKYNCFLKDIKGSYCCVFKVRQYICRISRINMVIFKTIKSLLWIRQFLILQLYLNINMHLNSKLFIYVGVVYLSNKDETNI